MLLFMSTARVRFPVSGPFHADLKRRVEAYFSGRTPHGGWRMRVKTAGRLAPPGGPWGAESSCPRTGPEARRRATSVWLLYGLFPLKWFFIDDFRQFVTGRIGTQRFPAARGWPLAAALLGKAVFFAWAFVLPALLHPTWWLIPLWLLASFTLGNVLAS